MRRIFQENGARQLEMLAQSTGNNSGVSNDDNNTSDDKDISTECNETPDEPSIDDII